MRNIRDAPPVVDGVTSSSAPTAARTIGLIGSGHIGSTVAKLAIEAGHDVVLSNSRGPDTLAGLVAELGSHASARTAQQAAERGDIVVVTIPLKNYRDVPAAPLASKIVVDTNNYYPQRDGNIAELDSEQTTVSELLQAHLPNSSVVKAFNHLRAGDLAAQGQPSGTPGRRALAIAGDDDTAKTAVTALIDSFGYDVVDAGPLSEGWRFQRDTPAYLPRLDTAGLTAALTQAERYAEIG